MANKVTITTPGPAGPTGLTWKNIWATSTSYAFRDVVRYASDGNLYFCTVAHTSGTILPTNISYWNIFVDNNDSYEWANTAKHTLFTDGTGTSGYSSKHYALKSQDWASLTTDAVTNDANASDVGYSAKSWAIGGTEVTGTASRGAAKEWAITTGAKVDGSSGEYSAKEYAIGTTVADGSSKEWATVTGTAISGSEFSAKEYAQGTAATGGSAKEWAQDTSAAVDTTFSAKEYAQGSLSGTGGSAKNWATQFNADVTGASTGSMSAKEWAIGALGRGVASEGSSKDWSTYVAGTVDDAGYSSKEHAVGTQGAAGTATTGGSAKNWASETIANTATSGVTGAGSGSFSSKVYAQATETGTSTYGGSAKSWAQTAKNTQVPGAGTSDRSAKHYAEIASDYATTTSSNSDRFLTAASSDPTTRDPNGSGSALQEGDMYFNTSQNKMKVRNASNAWQDTSSSIAGVASVTEYNGSQATNNKWFALTHDVGLQIVWLNGVRQVQGSDYYCVNSNSSTTNITSGTATHIYFISNVASSDVISFMAFGQVSSTAVVAKSGGTFTGAVTFEGQNTHNTGSNTFTMPTTRGSDAQVLTRTGTSGATTWASTVATPTITSVTTPASDNSINEDTNVTMTINGSNLSNSMSVSLIDATSGASVTGHNNLGIASFVSASQITVNTVAATSNISNSNVKVKLDNAGLTATSSSISVSPDPAFSAPSSDGTTLATITDHFLGNIEVVGSSGIVATASDSAAITYALDQTSTNANNTWQFNTTTGVVTSPTAGVYDVPSGSSYQEPFTVTATAGVDSSRTDNRTFNIIVNKSPTGGDTGGANNPSGAYSIYEDGGIYYQIHRFTTTGTNTLTLYSAITADILVVAGGGSGGGTSSRGAGGAGGLRWFTGQSLVAGAYTCTVGSGGGTPPSSDTTGYSGSLSSFIRTGANAINISASGGGAGGGSGSQPASNGVNGGSGGGANWNGSAGAGDSGNHTPDEGNNGGVGFQGTLHGGGGGGGAGDAAVGGDGTATAGGVGGEGASNFKNQSTTAFTQAKTTAFLAGAGAGEEVSSVRYIAGGGAGGVYASGSSQSGGHGGGGNGGFGGVTSGSGAGTAGTAGIAGTNGTGSGGGGGTYGHKGGAGGSGIIIIRFPV